MEGSRPEFPRVALVHDWLTGKRGGEWCLEAFLDLFPDADIYTLLHVPGAAGARIDERVVGTSFLQCLPFSQRYYRLLLPLFPLAARSLRLQDYDLVISLSHAAAKNVSIPPGAVHICYCFTPMRYVWDQAEQYFGRLTSVLWPVIRYLRRWDRQGSKRVDCFVAISRFVGARIRRYYGRSSRVIYPPVETSWIPPAKPGSKGVAFLYAGALVPYKRADLVVEAFNRIGEELWVVGTGPEEKRLKAMAGRNIHFFGRVEDCELADFFKRCRALVFPAKEDFGMIPVECMAAGRPVIALHAGGCRETVFGVRPWLRRNGVAACRSEEESGGVFMRNQPENQVEALVRAIAYFIEHEDRFRVESCRALAETFSPDRFETAWRSLLKEYGFVYPARETPAGRPPGDVDSPSSVPRSVMRRAS